VVPDLVGVEAESRPELGYVFALSDNVRSHGSQ